MNNKIFWILIPAFLANANTGISYDTLAIEPFLIVACTVWTPEGKVFRSYVTNDGKFHGFYNSYYRTGQLKESIKYKNGEIIDTSYGYYVNGKLEFIGVRNGQNVTLSEDGDTIGISYSCDGKPCGKSQDYYSDGKINSIVNYNDSGQKHGLCESWREDGTRKDSIVYHNGNIIELRAYFLNGKVRHWIKKVDKDSYKTLEAFYYDTSGAVCGEVKNGNGNFISWSDNYENRWLKSYKNGEEVASRELEPDENPDWK